MDYLSAAALMPHVRYLAGEIGPRPAGHIEELRARRYIQNVLNRLGYDEVETQPFPAPDTWGYSMIYPTLLSLVGNALPGRAGRLLGGGLSLASAYFLWTATGAGRQPLTRLATRRQSANLILRVPPRGEVRRRLVLLGHTDSNKARFTFHPALKKGLLGLTTAGMGVVGGNAVAQLVEGLGGGEGAARFRKASNLATLVALLLVLLDERGEYIPGASDNASAVACLLGLAAHLKEHPLEGTEVWFVFTGAEEVGCMGAHALLDDYGETLRDAWFLDLEMVATEEIAYVTRHSSLSLLTPYRPDADSLAWAERTARAHPELDVTEREMIIVEEVGALRGRGYRGLCLAGYGEDGWLKNWHQATDNLEEVAPAGLEKASRFAWAMMEHLDAA